MKYNWSFLKAFAWTDYYKWVKTWKNKKWKSENIKDEYQEWYLDWMHECVIEIEIAQSFK